MKFVIATEDYVSLRSTKNHGKTLNLAFFLYTVYAPPVPIDKYLQKWYVFLLF